ncbi:MAG: sodium:calcium antiporter [Sulfitobacter sp.]|nr:sodium:calcium antiporter [Sulfitobacter sp.]
MENLFPETLPLSANVALFLLAAGLVWFSGTRMVYYGDEMAERFGITREFVGLFFLATATELPEIVTTLTAAAAGNANLVMGNMFGGVTMQTAILAVADIFVVHRALTSWPRKPTHALEAVFLIIFLNVLLIFTIFKEIPLTRTVGLGAFLLFVGYPLTIWVLRRYDMRSTWTPIDIPEESEGAAVLIGARTLAGWGTGRLIGHALIAALAILVAGYVTADRAGVIAEQTGLSASFMGIAFLAAATSTPELSTTIAAARIGAYTMAISNIFGSNLIMLALILPADLVYRRGPILAEADQVAQISIVTGVIVTAIYVAGLLIRRTPRMFGAGVDSLLVLAIYIGSLFVLYRLQSG